ncbi:MAG: SusC/RagA family TonB-linked outer membrane protein [Longimicrobiales bacterium]|nr:SusC/RagA family TonB-linked outer membrane protein [Longimicrobiales bacterium]
MRPVIVRLLGSLLLAALLPAAAWSQTREVTGVVVNEFNRPLEFVLVTAVATGVQAQSGANGRFTLNVPAGETQVRFESFGFRTQTVTIAGGTTEFRVVMVEDALNLEGIVVTGQTTNVARRNLANAVASVTSAEIEDAPAAATVEGYLQGKVPGAYIESNSGAPGGGLQVRLRGVSTINGELEPLYVIDGVVMSNISIPNAINQISLSGGGSNGSNQDDAVNRIADLNPQDIERIEILKGPSAAALYGSRAANGVVIITTKRGAPGARRINVTQRFGMFDFSNKFEFRQWTRQDALDAGLVDAGNVDQFFTSGGDPINAFDLEDLIAGEHDVSYETLVSVSGGTQDTRYFVSGAWKDDAGIIDRTGFQRQSIRLNLDQDFSDRVRGGVSLNLARSETQRGLTNNDNSGTSFYMVLPFTPNFVDLRQQADGTFPSNPFERSNPLQTIQLFQNDETVWRYVASGNLEADLFRGEQSTLRVLGTAGVDFFTQDNVLFSPPELQFEPNDGLAGTSSLSKSSNRDITLSGNVIYNREGDSYSSTTTFGIQFEDRELDISRTLAQGLTAGQQNINVGVQTSVNQFRSRVKDLGFFAQEELLLMDERLLLSAGIRADRSSVNGDTEDYFFYPKAAASYRFDDLGFGISSLKLRAAWGQSGNQPLFGQKFTPLTATGNINGIAGLVVQGTTGAQDLQPEQQTEIEGGFDLTLHDGRAAFEFTVYQKDIDDLILQRTPAPSTGFTQQVFNGGEVRVRGVEAALSAELFRTENFQWLSRTTYSRDYSRVESLPVPAFETGGFGTGLGAFRIEEGASLTQIVSTIGQDEQGDPVVAKVGDANPSFRMGFSNDITWKNFRVGSLFDWSHGNSVINLTRLLADAGQNTADYRKDVRTRTLADGTTGEFGIGEFRFLNWAIGNDTRGFIEGASYLKLRELSLSYEISPDHLRPLLGQGLRSASITLSGRNLWTVTDYSGLDPEVSNFGSQAVARNIDVAPFPPSRSFWLSINFGF